MPPVDMYGVALVRINHTCSLLRPEIIEQIRVSPIQDYGDEVDAILSVSINSSLMKCLLSSTGDAACC